MNLNAMWPHGELTPLSPVAGEQFTYTFDTIGNRTATAAGGDSTGNSTALRTAHYHANLLNQYTNRDVPGAVDVMGLALATNTTLRVNGQLPYKKVEYFRQQLNLNNTNTPVWQSVTVSATNQTTVNGNVFVARTPEQFAYDLDGNLTNDGRWSYTWDAENRLIKMAANTTVGPTNSLQFDYDWRGRRIRKQVWSNTNWHLSPTNDQRFLYDGWNLVGVFNSSLSIQTAFLWGLDLSGSPQGAGGVGGLLAIAQISNSQITNCGFAAYDGNGNVAALVSATAGTNCAQYEYGPFGELLRATGPVARANPLRFSTKFDDDETDFLYYGYRYYNPNTGRWISRDPVGEDGGLTLYAFVDNSAMNGIDSAGLCYCDVVSFRITSKNWHGNFGRSWPSDGIYHEQLKVDFTLVLNPGADKSCCRIRQTMTGHQAWTGASLDYSAAPDGGEWWDGSSWHIGGSHTWSGSTATFQDDPGMEQLVGANKFPF